MRSLSWSTYALTYGTWERISALSEALSVCGKLESEGVSYLPEARLIGAGQSWTRKYPTWHRMQTLWMRSILWKHHTVLWYTLECNFIHVHKEARLSPEPVVTKLSISQERCVHISDTECQSNWTRSVERRVRNYLKLLSAVWLSLCGFSWNSQLIH